MEIEGVRVGGGSSERVAALVDGYARRVYPAVLEQHVGASVSSPLGVWLLLAACVTAGYADHRAALEEVVGCSADEASDLLAAFMATPPPALKAAIAVWVSVADANEELAGWVRGLPAAVESGFMPTQRDADAWAEKKTLGLINSFPLLVNEATRIVLASALATKVSWQIPFEVVPASEHLGETSPWREGVERMLWDSHPGGLALIADTRSAGLVAVHQAVAEEDLTVISVSADPGVPRAAVLDAAHEVAAFAREGSPAAACSLFDLPLGSGHSWQITDRETRTYRAGERVERIGGVSLPAWHATSRLDLRASELFGTGPALEVIRELIGSGPNDMTEAAQVAIASFTPYGFEAAAVTTFAVATALHAEAQETGTERTAVLRFDHPYAAVAIAGHPTHPQNFGQHPSPFRRSRGCHCLAPGSKNRERQTKHHHPESRRTMTDDPSPTTAPKPNCSQFRSKESSDRPPVQSPCEHDPRGAATEARSAGEPPRRALPPLRPRRRRGGEPLSSPRRRR